MATATVQNEKPLKVNKSRQKDDYADDEKTTKDEVDLGAKVDDLMATTDEWMQKKEIESDDNLVVFVHGWHNTDKQADERADLIDVALNTKKVVTTAFNWQWSPKWKLDVSKNYSLNQKIAGGVGAECLANYVKLVMAKRGDRFKRVTLIAHSMGCFLLCVSILKHNAGQFKDCNIICMAADVSVEHYQEAISARGEHGTGDWSHFYNHHDLALKASSLPLLFNGEKRAGLEHCKVLPKDQNFEWKGKAPSFGHSYIESIFSQHHKDKGFLDDITNLIEGNGKLPAIEAVGQPFAANDEKKLEEALKAKPLTKEEEQMRDKLEAKRNEMGFQGSLFIVGNEGYGDARIQYGTTSQTDPDMRPGMILYATGDDDVIRAIKYCRANGIAMSVRTGGHQYCGYSSTGTQNMQVDVSKAYPQYQYNKRTNTVICGPSHALGDWAGLNHKEGIYLPMGICYNVHLGGHVHTGGWGMVARSHGLLADHVKAFDIIIGTGEKVHVVKPETTAHDEAKDELHELNDDLYFGVLGGSIGGNFGVVTQFEFTPIRDADHPNSACYLMFWPLTKENMLAAVSVMQEYTVKCEDGTIPSDYEFGLTITGAGQIDMIPVHVQELMTELGDLEIKADMKHLESSESAGIIQMWMAYTNKGGAEEEFDEQWFDYFKKRVGEPLGKVLGPDGKVHNFGPFEKKKTPISFGLANMFIMRIEREMEYPFIKRDRTTPKVSENYAEVYTELMCKVTDANRAKRGVHLVSQMQVYGGSAVQSNMANCHSSFSWRDQCMLWQCHDAFYDCNEHKDAKQYAQEWQQETDKLFVGKDGAFCDRDLRAFAYTWLDGEKDEKLEDQWQKYYDSKEKYDRLRRIKFKADPDSVFNSSSFCLTPLKD